MKNKVTASRRGFLKSASLLSTGACLTAGSTLMSSCSPQKPAAAAGERVRDRFWIFTNAEGTDDHRIEKYGIRGGSRMSPAESAYWLGLSNIHFIRDQNLPAYPNTELDHTKNSYEQYAISFEPLKRVGWSVIGSGGAGSMDELNYVLDLAKKYPNISAVFLDDFIIDHNSVNSNGVKVGKLALSPDQLKEVKARMAEVNKNMELWVTLYTDALNPGTPRGYGVEPDLPTFIDLFDVVSLWTWRSEEIVDIEKNLSKLEAIAKDKTKVALGIYVWDYSAGKVIPLDLMKHQCELGLKWLKEGRIHNMIFLGNTLFDFGFESVNYIKKFIAEVGDEVLVS